MLIVTNERVKFSIAARVILSTEQTMSVQELLPTPAASSSATSATAELGVLYEHPAWFDRLFAELDRRGIHYHKLLAPGHFYDPGARDQRLALLFNRMSPS